MVPPFPVVFTTPYCAEARALFSRMPTTPSAAEKGDINTAIVSLKNAGLWARLGVLYPTGAAASAANALLDWKGFSNLTAVNSPGWDAQGFNSDGATSGLDLGVTAGAIPGITLNDNHLAGWTTGGAAANLFTIGRATVGGTFTLNNGGFGFSVRLANTSSAIAIGAETTVAAYYIGTRRASNANEAYKNTASIGTSSAASASLGSGNVVSLMSQTSFSSATGKVRLIHAGSQLSAQDVSNLYAIFSQYFASRGI